MPSPHHKKQGRYSLIGHAFAICIGLVQIAVASAAQTGFLGGHSDKLEVLEVYRSFKKMDFELAYEPVRAAELTKAALISGKTPEEIYGIYKEARARLIASYTFEPLRVAELITAAVCSNQPIETAISKAEEISKRSGELGYRIERGIELATAAMLSGASFDDVLSKFEEIKTKALWLRYEPLRAAEVTTASLVTGKSTEEVLAVYNELVAIDGNLSYKPERGLKLATAFLAQRHVAAGEARSQNSIPPQAISYDIGTKPSNTDSNTTGIPAVPGPLTAVGAK